MRGIEEIIAANQEAGRTISEVAAERDRYKRALQEIVRKIDEDRASLYVVRATAVAALNP